MLAHAVLSAPSAASAQQQSTLRTRALTGKNTAQKNMLWCTHLFYSVSSVAASRLRHSQDECPTSVDDEGGMRANGRMVLELGMLDPHHRRGGIPRGQGQGGAHLTGALAHSIRFFSPRPRPVESSQPRPLKFFADSLACLQPKKAHFLS